MWSSHSSSSQSVRKSTNDSSADNSVQELTSDEEADDPPTPVNETYDEMAWNEATDEPQMNSNKKLSNQEVGDNRKRTASFIGPQQHSCYHCFSGAFNECSTSRVFHMQETTRSYPPIVAKHHFRVCDDCGLTCTPMYFEPIASGFWNCPPHHHSLHPNFHYRKNSREPEKIQEKLDFFESERQNLFLQMGLMNEQMESQANKIEHLESLLGNAKSQLVATEDLFQQSLLSKSSLENTKFDLLSEVTKLRLDLTSLEQSKMMAEDKCRKVENELSVIRSTLLEKETEISALRLTLAKMARTTGYLLTDNELSLLRGKGFSIDYGKNRTQSSDSRVIEKPPLPSSLRPSTSNASYSEPPSRRDSTVSGRQSPSASSIYRVNPPTQRAASPMQLIPRSTSAENMKPKVMNYSNYSTLPHLHGAQVLQQIQQQLQQHQMHHQSHDSGPSPTSPNSMSVFHNNPSLDSFRPLATSSPSSKHSGVVSFGKSFFRLKRGKRASSAPELAQEDQIISSARSSTSELPKSVLSLPPGMQLSKTESKPKGLRKIFSRPKRSPSTSSGMSDSAFNRGGFRSTSGPRLGYSPNDKKNININLPFSRWDTNLVADWFSIIGLGMYSNDCKRWCKNGEHLMRATAAEVEKELGIRNALHRKKLRLAVSAMSQESDDLTKTAAQLDYLWVARWLDDIGLPQYKDAFLDARIDGRVLHYLTVEDLFSLKITSQLHHASIRCGIQVLREHKFNNQCLKRRAAADESTITEWIPAEIALWTSHRVMEWLRSIDLSEYAPNLRGSGVHGALIIHEPAFNSDLLSTLLSIPSAKTLLRRHISTKFKHLIGNDLCKVKRDFECQVNYVPMIPGAKVKAHRRGHFTLMKKRRAELEYEDLVCPMADNSDSSQTSTIRSIKRQDSISSNTSRKSLNDNQRVDKVTDV